MPRPSRTRPPERWSSVATVIAVARNLKRGDAVSASLVFDYDTPADIALDELIDRVEITTETPNGGVYLSTTLDTELIPLNPNRVPLLAARRSQELPGAGGLAGKVVLLREVGLS